MAVAGLRGTGDWATDERPKNFRETILFRNPNGTAPIFALMGKTKSESTDDPEFAWWDEPNDIVRLQVNGALTSGATTVVVDSADPSTSAPDNRWGTASNLKAGDLLLVEPAADAATYDNEIIEVVSVASDTSFDVTRGAAGTTAAAIADNLFLLKIGSTYPEGSSAPDAASRNPIKYFNYTQIFQDTYDITNTAKETRTRTGDPVKNDKKRKAFDHSRDIEQAILWGAKNETTGSNGKPKRTFGGLRQFTPASRTTVFGAPVTIETFLDAVSPVFDFDTPAGDTRIAFCGNSALNELNKVIQNDAATQVQYNGVIKLFGMRMTELILPQGTLMLKSHPLLSRNTLYTKSMYVVDFASLVWRYMRSRDTNFKDNIQNNDEDRQKGRWLTEGGLEVRFGGLTNAYLGNISST